MSLPAFDQEGFLPPGIYAASFQEVTECFGSGTEARERQMDLLRSVLEAARHYPTIKRVLLWGSFVTTKQEPNDLDYSLIVSIAHQSVQVAPEHARFLSPSEARRFYGVDVNYLLVYDYPLPRYIERLDFMCQRRDRRPCGIVEIPMWGGFEGDSDDLQ